MSLGDAFIGAGMGMRGAKDAIDEDTERALRLEEAGRKRTQWQQQDEDREYALGQRERQAGRDAISDEMFGDQVADYRRGRSADATVRENLGKGHGVQISDAQVGGDFSQRKPVAQGRTKGNMFDDAAETYLQAGDDVNYKKYKQMSQEAESEGLRDLVRGYIFDGARGPQLAEIWNRFGKARVDPNSIEDDGNGNVSGVDVQTGQRVPMNMGQMAQILKMLPEDEWTESKDGQWWVSKRDPSRRLAMPPSAPVGKDRYITRKVGEHKEVLFDTHTQRDVQLPGANGMPGGAAELDKDTANRMWKTVLSGKGEFDNLDDDAKKNTMDSFLNGVAILQEGAKNERGVPVSPEEAAAFGEKIVKGTMTTDGIETINGKQIRRFQLGQQQQAAAPGQAAAPQVQADGSVGALSDGRKIFSDGKGNYAAKNADGSWERVTMGQGAAQPAAQPAAAQAATPATPAAPAVKPAPPAATGLESIPDADLYRDFQKEEQGMLSGSGGGESDRYKSMREEMKRRGAKKYNVAERRSMLNEINRKSDARIRAGFINNNPKVKQLFTPEEIQALLAGKPVNAAPNGKADGGKVMKQSYANGGKVQGSGRVPDRNIKPIGQTTARDGRSYDTYEDESGKKVDVLPGVDPHRSTRFADGGRVRSGGRDTISAGTGNRPGPKRTGGLVRREQDMGRSSDRTVSPDLSASFKPVTASGSNVGAGQGGNVLVRDWGGGGGKSAGAGSGSAPGRGASAGRNGDEGGRAASGGGSSRSKQSPDVEVRKFQPGRDVGGGALKDKSSGSAPGSSGSAPGRDGRHQPSTSGRLMVYRNPEVGGPEDPGKHVGKPKQSGRDSGARRPGGIPRKASPAPAAPKPGGPEEHITITLPPVPVYGTSNRDKTEVELEKESKDRVRRGFEAGGFRGRPGGLPRIRAGGGGASGRYGRS